MQAKISQRIELLGNIVVIIIAVLLGYFLIQKFFFQPASSQPIEIAKGTKISLPDVDWHENQKTLILALQKGCHFCTESMPFYKTLAEKAKAKGVKLIAVLPNSLQESEQYLKENSLEVKEVRQIQLTSINVRLTPMVILVNGNGEVEKSWIGKLPPNKENEVIEDL